MLDGWARIFPMIALAITGSPVLPPLGLVSTFAITLIRRKRLSESKVPYPATSTGPVTLSRDAIKYGSTEMVPSSCWPVADVNIFSWRRADVGKLGSQPASPISVWLLLKERYVP